MRITVVSAVLWLAGCGVQQDAPSGLAQPVWPDLCPDVPRSHGPWDEEDPECWRAGFPVQSCDAPLHPELVGVWGLERRGFEGGLIYDGCCVTFYIAGLYGLRTIMEEFAEHYIYGRAANVGPANRTQAVWEGDTLYSVSHLGSMEVGHRVTEGGVAHLSFVDEFAGERRERSLVRLGPHHCIDERTRSLLCARLVVPGGGYAAESPGACPEQCTLSRRCTSSGRDRLRARGETAAGR